MVEKIKANLDKITLILSIVAGALIVPTIVDMFDNSLTESTIVNLVEALMILLTSVLLIVSHKNLSKIVTVATVLFYTAFIVYYVYVALDGGFSAYARTALYAAIVILTFVPTCKKAWYVTMLISVAFFLASALGGGAYNLSVFITALVLFANNYLNNKGE